jgi:hypothetical protein
MSFRPEIFGILPFPPVPPSTGPPIHYWTLDETTGDRLDSIGGLTLTQYGTVASGPGLIGNAIVLTGTQVLYNVSGLPDFSTSFTLTVWFKAQGWGAEGAYQGIVGKGDSAPAYLTHEMYALFRNDVSPIGLYVQYGTAALPGTVIVPWALDTSGTVWTFICFRFNATTQLMTASVNATAPVSVSGVTPIHHADAGFALGQFIYSNTGHLATGAFDEVGFYDHYITDAEVTALFNSGAGHRPLVGAGLEHYWKLDEVGPGTRDDSVGSNDLTVMGTTVGGAATGLVGSSFDSNNGAAYLQGANLNLAGRSFTLAGWVQAYGGDSTLNTEVWLCSQGNSQSSTNDFDFRYTNNTQTAPAGKGLRFGWGSAFQYEIAVPLASPIDITGTVWNFMCVRYDLATQTMRLRWNNTDATPQVGAAALTNNGAPFWVGHLQYSTGVYTNRARIDELMVYDRSLTDSEVSTLFNGGAGFRPVS